MSLCGAVAESLRGHAGVCVCQHFAGGAADSHHPRLPAPGRRQETGAPVAGQQPGSEGDRRWSAQVGRERITTNHFCECHHKGHPINVFVQFLEVDSGWV